MDKDPFGYPALTYLWVIGLAAVAASVRHLHDMRQFSAGRLFIDALTGGFTGLLTFWLCEGSNITGPWSAFLIGMSGLMGSRAWQEFVNILRFRLGLPQQQGGAPPFQPPPQEGLNPGDTGGNQK